MKLPLADEAEVPKAKIVLYLLNPEHRRGKSKARFFLSRGFSADNWETMAGALRRHAAEHEIVKEEPTPLGVRISTMVRAWVRWQCNGSAVMSFPSKARAVFPAGPPPR